MKAILILATLLSFNPKGELIRGDIGVTTNDVQVFTKRDVQAELDNGTPIRFTNGVVEVLTVTNEPHIGCDRTLVPEKLEQYRAAWDVAATLQKYQVPAEATGIRAVYFLDALAKAEDEAAKNETDPVLAKQHAVTAQGIRDDGQRLSGLLLFLGVDWRKYLDRYETETRTVTVWRKVE